MCNEAMIGVESYEMNRREQADAMRMTIVKTNQSNSAKPRKTTTNLIDLLHSTLGWCIVRGLLSCCFLCGLWLLVNIQAK